MRHILHVYPIIPHDRPVDLLGFDCLVTVGIDVGSRSTMKESRPSTRRRLLSILLYGATFLVPPLLVGLIVALKVVGDWMEVSASEPLVGQWPELSYSPEIDPKKPTAAVVLSNGGTETTDLLAPYGILASSEALNVVTVAPERTLSPFWSGADIMPHFSFEELERKLGGPPDLILVPNIADPENKTIVEWIQRNSKRSQWLVSVCKGARVLAEAGLLQNRRASSHYLSFGDLEQKYPDTQWTRGVRFVEDGNIITSAGVTASIDATFQALNRAVGEDVAKETAQKLHYDLSLHPRRVDPFDFKTTDFVALFMTAGFLWNRTDRGILLYEGIDEIALGSLLDLYPRVFSGEAATAAPDRRPILSKHGLILVPWWHLDRDGIDAIR